jgi:CubicO group peptidase (beta-lactamase class C family)/pimeloyl-ACP methyl ester carboxylesterase
MVLLLLIVLVMVLVGCDSHQARPTSTPASVAEPAATDIPAVEPTDAPTAVPTDDTASAGALPRVEPLDECFVEMPEGAAYECLRVEVPEFHDQDKGGSIKLGVIRLLSTADTPAEPLFFAEGGPGGSNVDTAPLIAHNMLDGEESVYTDLLSTRDLVFFTQRGTLYSEPALMCSEETMEPVVEAFTVGVPAQEREQIRTDAIKACLDEYAAAGVDFAAYNSVENAADVNSIREVLGYDQIVLYGDSYGTVLSQHVMRDFPDTLAAVILDGVDTLSAPSWVTQDDAEFQSALEYAIGLCEADQACSEAYPNLATDVEAVYQKLETEPYLGEVEGTQYFLDESLAAAAFFEALYSPYTAYILPLAVDNLLNDKQDERMVLLSFLTRPRFESIGLPMHFAMVCSEDPVTSVDDARSLDEVYSVVSEHARSDASSYIEICSYMNLPVLPDETDLPVSSDVPVLLLSGALDPATPASNAEEVVATLPNGFSFEFPYGGHVQFLSDDPCAESIVASFIADPTTEPDSSCIAETVLYPFALPAEETAPLPAEAGATAEPTGEEAAGAASGTLPEDIVRQLDAYLQSQVYAEGGNPELAAPGLVLYVETPDGRYLNATGLANLEDGTPIQVDDVLQIGSNTKSMVIVLLMQLVEEGVLSLDDLLSEWLPEQAAIVPNSDRITIRQMAMHTAGIHDYEEGIITQGLSDPAKLQAAYSPAEVVQFAMDDGEPTFGPGEEGQWEYSNTGYILLGMIIEAATGESLNDLLQARIFDPLGLESAVLIEGVPQEGEITTKGYKWTEDGERLDTTNWNGSQGWAAGAVAMTAEDLATYGRALAAGEFFQDPDTLAEMLMFNPDALESGFPYGMGLIDFAGDGTVWGHAGATPGFQSEWYTDPEDGIIVVGLTNSGDYSAWGFLNVLNILEGNGAQPFGPMAMLPGQLFGTIWAWEKLVTPAEADEIDEAAGLVILVRRDGIVAVSSTDCGEAQGTYTSSGMGNIDFDIDGSSLTCAADSQAGQFVQYLNDATSWSFDNGSLLIELPADSGTMVFKYVLFG